MKFRKQTILLILIILLATILRIVKLNSVPVSAFGDELDVGYQAYSILETGKDYMGNFLPLHFKSLAEWRTPLYIYSAVPSVWLFGISTISVRLPAAIFGILSVWVIYLLAKRITGNDKVGLFSALLLAISPWHLQYSRAGFEVTQLLFFYMIGIYFLLKGLKSGKWLPLAAICLGLTPWIYSTAKLFLPLTVLAILIIWKNDLLKVSKTYLIWAAIIFSVVTVPFAINTIFGGGSERIEGISIFSDPKISGQVGFGRLNDMQTRGGDNQPINIFDKLFHNPYIIYIDAFIGNYLHAFSTDFLFITGDILNPRQSSGTEFYKIEAIFLLMGLLFFLSSSIDKKIKAFFIFWLVVSPIPSALTQGGGAHATRLILMLPILIILIAFGIYNSYLKINKKYRNLFIILTSTTFLLAFIFYQHNYWVHYPWQSERWWQSGYEQAIKLTVQKSSNYERVIISSADEPSLKFFLGWSMYPPARFQDEYRLYLANKDPNTVLKLDQYEFPPVGQSLGLYEMASKLPEKTLYLATAKEVNLNLIKEPGRVPSDLVLIESIQYPSGEPAFYLFTKK